MILSLILIPNIYQQTPFLWVFNWLRHSLKQTFLMMHVLVSSVLFHLILQQKFIFLLLILSTISYKPIQSNCQFLFNFKHPFALFTTVKILHTCLYYLLKIKFYCLDLFISLILLNLIFVQIKIVIVIVFLFFIFFIPFWRL